MARAFKKLWKWSPASAMLGVFIFVLWLSSVVWSQNQNFGSIVLTSSSVSSVTVKVLYATDTKYAGGVKANGHLFIATLNTTGAMSALFEMDGTTPYNPITSGVSVGDYVACVDIFGKSSQTAALEMDDGTVQTLSATTMQSTNHSSNSFTGANCWTGTDDTAALKAVQAANITTAACGSIVILPAGRIIYSSQPFINTGTCSTKVRGQGAGITAGGTCCLATRDYATVFTPTNGFPFQGGGNVFQSLLSSDSSNGHGEFSNFAIDALGMPFSSAVANKNGLSVASNYVHDVNIVGFWPSIGASCAFAANTTGAQFANVAAQGDNTAACINAQNMSINNPQFGNNGTNWLFTNANNIMVSNGFEDEELNNTGVLVNSTNIRFTNIFFLGAAANFAFTVDGTSSIWFDQSSMATMSAGPGQSVSIASGGKMTAQSTTFGTGNSTTNASIHNLGTYFDNGQNKCATFTGAANNSGGTIPGSCVDNASNQPITSLTHSVTNFTEGAVNLAASGIGNWTPDQNIQVTRIQAGNSAGNITCATPLVLQLSNGTTTQTLTLTSGQSSWDTGAVSKLFVSGTNIALTQTAAGACATPPVNLNISILWMANSGT